MKRKITILLASCLLLAGTSFGQRKPDLKASPNKLALKSGVEIRADDGYAVFSYTTGLNFTMAQTVSLLSKEPASVAMAIDLVGDTYKGQELAGTIVYLSKNRNGSLPSNLKLIVVDGSTQKLVGEKVVEAANIKEGFNTIILDEPMPIEEGKTYQVGYFIATESNEATDWFTCDPDAASIPEGFRVINTTQPGPIEDWKFDELSDLKAGPLAIFALINDIDGTWKNVASISGSEVERRAVVGETFLGTLVVDNKGVSNITSATVSYQIEDKEELFVEIPTNIEPGYRLPIEAPMIASKAGIFVTKIKITAVNGESNPMGAEAVTGVTIGRSEGGSSEMNSVLLERFTVESSFLCPKIDINEGEFRESLEESGFKISRIAHRIGGTVDWLTNEDSKPLMQPLNAKAAFLTINRHVYNGNVSLMPVVPELNMKFVEESTMYGTNAKITAVEQTYDKSTQKLSIRVKGETFADVDPNNVYVNIVITESGIEAINQAGAEDGYTHHDVPRIFATGAYGEKLTITDATFSFEMSDIEIPEEYKTENLKVVVFLSRNIESPEYEWDINVYDSETLFFGSGESIEDVSDQTEVFVTSRDGAIIIEGEYSSALVYDLAGRQVAQTGLASGTYIVRVETPQGIVVRKIAVR